MGIMRKMTSIGTLGMVRYRNRAERNTRYARQTRNAARVANAQRAVSLELQRDRIAQAEVQHADVMTGGAYSALPAPPPGLVRAELAAPPGWYRDRNGDLRFFDGSDWTGHVHPEPERA